MTPSRFASLALALSLGACAAPPVMNDASPFAHDGDLGPRPCGLPQMAHTDYRLPTANSWSGTCDDVAFEITFGADGSIENASVGATNLSIAAPCRTASPPDLSACASLHYDVVCEQSEGLVDGVQQTAGAHLELVLNAATLTIQSARIIVDDSYNCSGAGACGPASCSTMLVMPAALVPG